MSLSGNGKRPRPLLVAGNWKMNLVPREAASCVGSLTRSLAAGASPASRLLSARPAPPIEALIFPAAPCLPAAIDAAKGSEIQIGAQNAHHEKHGAFTGEISAPMLQDLGIAWTLVGHSERRHVFREDDELVSRRGRGLLEQGLRVLYCVGETREERERGQTEAVLGRQIDAIAGYPAGLRARLALAYEPVWAIGTGLTATPEQAAEAHRFCRSRLQAIWGEADSTRTRILYGGSVTPQNTGGLLRSLEIDGVLVGGASLKPESFLAILEEAARWTDTPAP